MELPPTEEESVAVVADLFAQQVHEQINAVDEVCAVCDCQEATMQGIQGESSVCSPLCLLRQAEGRYQPHLPDEGSPAFEAICKLREYDEHGSTIITQKRVSF